MKNNYSSNIYLKMYRKYWISKIIHIVLNTLLFCFSSSIIAFSIYAIKRNPFPSTKGYYVAISVIMAFITVLSSLISIFKINRKKEFFEKKIKEIDQEYEKYKNDEIDYKENKSLIFKNVNKIIEDI